MSDEDSEDLDIPHEISDDETIVRVVVQPAHFNKKGKLRRSVFKPKVGDTSLSVIRQLMGDDFCKDKGVEIGQNPPRSEYVGLVTITAKDIRDADSTVSDSRDEFWLGHADLDHGFPAPPHNEPGSAEDVQRLTERCDTLLTKSKYHKDSRPTEPGWHGDPLKIEK